jgi:hypothetical protein
VEGLLKFKIMCFDWPHVLVRWTGRDASGDRWEPLENLNDCKEANTAFQRVTGSTLPRPTAQRPPLSAGPGPAPPAFPPTAGQGSSSTSHPRRTLARRSSADSCQCSTGGRTMAVSAAPSPAFVSGQRSST